MAKILIIDDRPLNRQFLTTLLGYQQHQLSEASDGADGLRVAREERPDLIISDVLMPSMDGYEFVRHLRADPDIGATPVVFTTAHYLGRESQALAEKCGVTSIIFKPCEPKTLLDIVALALNERSEPDPSTPVQPDEFDREHQRILTNKLSDKTDQLRDVHAKLTALMESSTDLANEHDPVELLDCYCSVAREVIGARWALVVLLDRKQKTVRHLKVVGLALENSPALRSALLETGVFKTLMNERRTICLSDVTSTPAALLLPAALPRAVSLLVAPLTMRGQVDGWICLADKLGLDSFSEQEEQLTEALAANMAVAYDNASLYGESIVYARRLEAEISERSKIERQLSENKATLAGIIHAAIDAIVTVDTEQRIVMFNQAAEKMFQRTGADVIGQSLDRFIPALSLPNHSQDITTVAETIDPPRSMGPIVTTRPVCGVRADGEEFPLEASISQVEVAGQKLFTVIIRDISERQRAADALAESENRLRAILEAEPECVKLLAADGSLIDMNRAGLAMIEADSLAQVLGANVCQLVLPEHRQAFMAVNHRVFAGESANLEFEITAIKGTRRWLEMHAIPFRNKDDTIIASLGITRDITERRSVEKARRASEARYRTLFEYAPDGILIADSEGRYVDANASICRMLGYVRDELIGLHSSDVVAPAESEYIEPPLTTLKHNSDHHRQWELRRKDGSVFSVEVMATNMPDGNILAMIRDITARKESEKRIQDLNRGYAVLSDINQMIVRTRDPQTMFANACRIAVEKGMFLMAWIGLLDNETQRIKPQAWASAEEGYLESVNIDLRNEAMARGQTPTAVRDGQYLVVNDLETDPRMAPWRDELIKRGYKSSAAFPLKVDGQPIGNFNLYSGELGFFNDEEVRLLEDLALDISFALEVERREQERNATETLLRSKSEELAAMTAQLWQASKLATMGELAASIAHELNNPLATVSLRTEALLMQLPDDSDQRKPLEIISQEIDRMASLVNNLLQFSRRSYRQVSTLDTATEIATAVEFVHYYLRTNKIEVVREFADGLPTIQADRQQLRQVFLNLLTNASDAMPHGGRLTVRTSGKGLDDAAVAMEFIDSGGGITAANMEKIWEPFFTTKMEGKGTGLGLAICRRIVEEHGGTISVQSEIGQGTTVCIVLPATTNVSRDLQ